MKKTDIMFLTMLRQNARQTLTSISRKLNIPVTTLYDKLRQHKKSLIMRHTTLIDFSKMGYNARANIMFSLPKLQRPELRNYMMAHPKINSFFKINNGYDFLVEGMFKSIRELEEFIEKVEENFSISDKKTYFVVEEIKKESFLTRPENVSCLLEGS
jgi:Lrp/AsnC family leucine-responsive transcriptional regulator